MLRCAGMLITATVGATLLFTLFLPLYPTGLDGRILAFLLLTGVAGLLALGHRVARRELVVLSMWLIPVGLAAFVGGLRHGDAQQITEDILPYALFVLGLVAGRASAHPHRVLLIVFALCLIDSVASLVNVAPHYTPGFRSTYTYGRIAAGLSLLGVFVLLFLRRLDTQAGAAPSPYRSGIAVALHGVMILATIASGSRGMMLACVLGIAALAYLQKPSRALLVTIVTVLAFVGYSSVLADVGIRYFRAGQVSTIEGRFEEVRSSLELFAQHPLLGLGLGTTLVADGAHHAYVHNIIAYHLWKFGMIGSLALAVPLWIVGRQVRRYPRPIAAAAIAGAAAVFAYLVTCAGYKVYYVVWIYGVTAGAVLSALWSRPHIQRGGVVA